MNNELNLQDLAVSLQDFEASGWKEVVTQASSEGYLKMWLDLSGASRSAIEQGRLEHGKVLWLLADVCSMMLSPSSTNEPFRPYAVFPNRRSVGPDDFLESNITFFAEIVDAVDDNWLKARLSDLLWLKYKPRNVTFAVKAIDAYRSIPLDEDTWVKGGQDCWLRAISLAQMLKNGAGDRLQEMETSIVAAFNAAQMTEGFFGLWLADLLKSHGLGKTHKSDVALKLETLAREFDGEGDLHVAREYFSGAVEWYRLIPNADKEAEMTVAVAEGWVKEAVAQTGSENPNHMSAMYSYQNAIQTLRRIPRNERPAHGVDERIVKLRTLLNDSGVRTVGEMELIQTSEHDISSLIENARLSVSGKSVQDALLAFTNLHRGVSAELLRKSALKKMSQYPLLSLLGGSSVMSPDGRVIAKRPSLSLDTELTEDDEHAIQADMVREYGVLVYIVVQGRIWPALEVLLSEHRIQEADFITLARNSPIVPKDRAGLFGKALFAGYERDFVTALHLLVPQIEHLVRVHLKQAGAKTTNIDKNNIENENGLSTLMELPEAVEVFGEDLAFELNSLFCDAFGPNLRNELAHGLLDENKCNSHYSIYAWWLALRLTLNTGGTLKPDLS